MGTGGPGNIVHIDNLYVKDFAVKDDTNILLGDFVIIEATGVVRPIETGDFIDNDRFLDLSAHQVAQAGESANNLNATPVGDRKTTCECITIGSDWTVVMRPGTIPSAPVGILRFDAGPGPGFKVSQFQTDGTTKAAANEILGQYKHKEFNTLASISVDLDHGVISTGIGIS